MKIEAWYLRHFESRLKGRYISLKHIGPLLKVYQDKFKISWIGVSESEKEIPLVKIGHGEKVVLAWSQMHGNESTTTKGLFDFFKFICQNEVFQGEIRDFLDKYTLYVIPILNPDGAELYTRENSNKIDLNRDARDLSQRESRLLRKLFDELNPSLCLNLHDQRSIYGLANGLPASLSFLAPAANLEKEITPERIEAMQHIVRMNTTLKKFLPGRIGRYDETFNINCVGDTFQMNGSSTILFEAGHADNDYQREKTRMYIFYAFLSLFEIIEKTDVPINYKEYYSIPENKENFNDFILRQVKLNENDNTTSIAIQYAEKLIDGKVSFIPEVDEIGELNDRFGHVDINANGAEILINSHKKVNIGDKILIIVNKNDPSLIYFDKNNFLI